MVNLPPLHAQLTHTLAAQFAALPQVEAVALSGSCRRLWRANQLLDRLDHLLDETLGFR